MNKPDVILEKERDFTDIVNATFSFISQEFKLLFKVYALYAGIPIIAVAILTAIYSGNSFTNLLQTIQGKAAPVQPDFGVIAGMTIVSFIVSIFLAGLTAAYLDEYKTKGKGQFVAGDVWNNFFSQLPMNFAISIVTLLMIIVGIAFCLFPGIYLAMPLSLAITILYIEKSDFGDVIKRCFDLIKNNWWMTFGLVIVVYLIVAILGGLFSIPAAVIGMVQGFTIATGSAESFDSMPIIITTIIGGIGQYLLYPVIYIAIGIHYFNLREQKDKTSLFQKISGITNE